jgi:hypothetical protein
MKKMSKPTRAQTLPARKKPPARFGQAQNSSERRIRRNRGAAITDHGTGPRRRQTHGNGCALSGGCRGTA